ncbi:MAG: TrkA family potassium uptake protein [Actinomycetota bacterium]|nr:TrkA family potassium uptake protein [Actinomycetota bacterium]
MHVVVIGCGRVGSGLAQRLQDSGHTVAVVDKSPQAFRRLPDTFSGRRVTGLGFDRDALASAGIEEAEGLAAVTNGDNSNILSARIGRETYGVERVVARIYDPRRAVIYQRLGIPTVPTVAWTTDQVLRRLFPDDTTQEYVDPTGSVCLVERDLPLTWVGRRLTLLEEPGRIRLAAVTRFGEAHVASEDLIGQEHDIVHLAVALDALEQLQARLEGGQA